MENRNEFKTSSLNIVAWLLHKNIELKKYIRSGDITTFYFERSEELESALIEYNSNEIIKDFISKYRIVKNLAYQK